MKHSPILFGILLAALLPAIGCEKRKAGKPRLGEVERLPRVETVVLGKEAKLEVVRTYTATVEAFEKVDLCALMPTATTGGMRGVVKPMAREIEIGRLVDPKQTLIELDLPDLAAERDTKKAMVGLAKDVVIQAEQAIAVASAEIKEANVQVERYKAEVDFKVLKQQRVEDLVKAPSCSRTRRTKRIWS